MSLCDGANTLLKSYGFSLSTNFSETNTSNTGVDLVFNHWCHYNHVPKAAHYAVGALLIVICALSITGNLLVIVVFSRYRRLRSPANTLIVNLATSDMLNGCLHPMAVYSSFKEHWMFGKIGCEFYAALCGLFGLISIVTLTAIAIERCMVISVKPWYGGTLFTQSKAKLSIVIIWAYCFIIIFPPLVGWGAFVPEGFLTSCSFDYMTRTSSNRSYFLYIFILGFFLPVSVISVCYAFIIRTIFLNEKDMKRNNVKKVRNKLKKRNDYKAAEMIMFVIAMFLFSWTPYSTIAIIGQFGNTAILTPWVSVLPSLFAKMSTIYNPAIYGLSHRHFRATLKRMCKKKDLRSSNERFGTYVSKNSVSTRSKNKCLCLSHYGGSDVIDESSSSFSDQKVYIGVTVGKSTERNRIVYVKKTTEMHRSCRCDQLYRTNSNSYRDTNFSTGNYSEPTRTNTHGTPGILSLQHDAANMSLIRSLMFKSDSSIHQKYQIYLEKDHIVRIPSFISPYSNMPQRAMNEKKDSSSYLQPAVPYHVPRHIRVLKIESVPFKDIIPNVPNQTNSNV